MRTRHRSFACTRIPLSVCTALVGAQALAQGPSFTVLPNGNADQDDVSCLIAVVAGNNGCTSADPDFNRDGNVDQDDVAVLISVIAGGDCP